MSAERPEGAGGQAPPRPDVADSYPETDLESCMATLAAALNAHAGGLELLGISGDGTARIRYTGMCAGCLLKPLTTAALVAPLLTRVADIQTVHVEGGRISAEAEARVLAAVGHDHRGPRSAGSAMYAGIEEQ
jgi:Fe-S cluster biogenesis protein NfuA